MNDSYVKIHRLDIIDACDAYIANRQKNIDAKKEKMIQDLIGKRRADTLWIKVHDRESAIKDLEGDPWSDYGMIEMTGWRFKGEVDSLKESALRSKDDLILVSSSHIHIIKDFLG